MKACINFILRGLSFTPLVFTPCVLSLLQGRGSSSYAAVGRRRRQGGGGNVGGRRGPKPKIKIAAIQPASPPVSLISIVHRPN